MRHGGYPLLRPPAGNLTWCGGRGRAVIAGRPTVDGSALGRRHRERHQRRSGERTSPPPPPTRSHTHAQKYAHMRARAYRSDGGVSPRHARARTHAHTHTHTQKCTKTRARAASGTPTRPRRRQQYRTVCRQYRSSLRCYHRCRPLTRLPTRQPQPRLPHPPTAFIPSRARSIPPAGRATRGSAARRQSSSSNADNWTVAAACRCRCTTLSRAYAHVDTISRSFTNLNFPAANEYETD